jgi:EAL domain-containing protein (putative c-di-GMP-specific phosphodiesterase class I)
MGELFRTVLESALAEQRRWSEQTGLPIAVSVNVSPVQLGAELVTQVHQALERWRPEDGSLWLELTESTVADLSDVVDVLGQLRALGTRLAIDDFGTGHSSLSRVAAFPWDAIKIDRTFVEGVLHDRHARAVVEATIALGHALGALTIAEGVESGPQKQVLTELGCDVAQGYVLSPPVDAEGAAAIAVRLTLPARS